MSGFGSAGDDDDGPAPDTGGVEADLEVLEVLLASLEGEDPWEEVDGLGFNGFMMSSLIC